MPTDMRTKSKKPTNSPSAAELSGMKPSRVSTIGASSVRMSKSRTVISTASSLTPDVDEVGKELVELEHAFERDARLVGEVHQLSLRGADHCVCPASPPSAHLP